MSGDYEVIAIGSSWGGLKALSRVTTPIQARFVVGLGFANPGALIKEIEAAGFEVLFNVPELAAEFARADLALISFGVTAYEMAALGVPALYVTLTEDHAASASAFSTVTTTTSPCSTT